MILKLRTLEATKHTPPMFSEQLEDLVDAMGREER
jgi:hypothetical protein